MSFRPLGSHNDGLDISSAVTLTREAGATKLLMQALGQNVRFTLDGSAPTSSKGFQILVGVFAVVEFESGTVVKVIQEAATADFQYQFGI